MAAAGETGDHTAEAVDPVCGMTVPVAGAVGSWTHAGVTYHFCAPACLAAFRADPDRYAAVVDHRATDGGAKEAVDPVCGMTIPVAEAAGTSLRRNLYDFCHPACREEVKHNPERFLPDAV
ncbi:MAG: YHS domain-containing protein [Actinomycetia bacterium]|nr:YHS domain-containing protein [Actinomycetes bacterium]